MFKQQIDTTATETGVNNETPTTSVNLTTPRVVKQAPGTHTHVKQNNNPVMAQKTVPKTATPTLIQPRCSLRLTNIISQIQEETLSLMPLDCLHSHNIITQAALSCVLCAPTSCQTAHLCGEHAPAPDLEHFCNMELYIQQHKKQQQHTKHLHKILKQEMWG